MDWLKQNKRNGERGREKSCIFFMSSQLIDLPLPTNSSRRIKLYPLRWVYVSFCSCYQRIPGLSPDSLLLLQISCLKIFCLFGFSIVLDLCHWDLCPSAVNCFCVFFITSCFFIFVYLNFKIQFWDFKIVLSSLVLKRQM